jgi:hypothetical protein
VTTETILKPPRGSVLLGHGGHYCPRPLPHLTRCPNDVANPVCAACEHGSVGPTGPVTTPLSDPGGAGALSRAGPGPPR